MAGHRRGPIERAVYRDLDGHLLASGLGQATLAAARRMDAAPDDRGFAVLAREFRQNIAELRKVTPPVEQEDSLAKRRARRSATRGAAG